MANTAERAFWHFVSSTCTSLLLNV